jgi:NADPH2:quinone reductase
MPAIQVHAFGPPSVLTYDPAPLSLTPGPNQALIRLHAAGVNPVDTYIRAGQYARLPSLPYTPGTDGAGEVIALGEGFKRPDVTVGTRVWLCRSVTGTYASHCLAEARSICPMPDGMTFEQGAAVGVAYLTAWQALIKKAGATQGETVLIHGGSGGVGLAAIQFARQLGCTVIATAGTDAGLHQCIMAGADFAVNHREDAYDGKIMGLTDQRGPDIIIEMLANANLARDMAMIAPRGRIIIVGNRGEITINPRGLMAKDATVTGLSLFNATDLEWALAMRATREGLANATLKPVVREVLPLPQAAAAHELVMQPGAQGKIVLNGE